MIMYLHRNTRASGCTIDLLQTGKTEAFINNSRYRHTRSLNVALVTDETDGGGRGGRGDDAAAAAAVSSACSSAIWMTTMTKAVQNGVRPRWQ